MWYGIEKASELKRKKFKMVGKMSRWPPIFFKNILKCPKNIKISIHVKEEKVKNIIFDTLYVNLTKIHKDLIEL